MGSTKRESLAGRERESPMLNTGEAARLLGVTPSTVKRWADRGLIAFRRTGGGHRRFWAADIEAVRRRQTMPFDGSSPTTGELRSDLSSED